MGDMTFTRHAPLGRVRPRFASASVRSRPHAYVGRAGVLLPEMYASDHADARRGGRFRWVLSTCLAAAVGALAILVAVTGSMDSQDQDAASLEERLQQASLALQLPGTRLEGLRWSVPKTDKLLVPTGAIALRYYIAELVKQRRGTREYAMNKYYVRLAARLGPVSRKQAATVPPLNPIKLYADASPVEGGDRGEGQQEPGAPTKLIELNGVLPNEDGQELDTQEVARLVVRGLAADEESGEAGADLLAGRSQRVADVVLPQTTDLPKTVYEAEVAEDSGVREVAPVKAQRGDTLSRILARLGAQTWQVRAMLDAMRPVFAESELQPGYEVRGLVLPLAAKANGELVRFSVFDEAGTHKVTVTRNGTGEYVPSATRTEDRIAHV